MVTPIAIYGSGALGLELLSTIEAINAQKLRWKIVGFYDDNPRAKIPMGFKRLGGIQELLSSDKDFSVVLAVAGIASKKKLVAQLINARVQFTSIVHPTAILSRSTVIGENNYVGPYSVIGPNSKLGDHVYIGNQSSIGHDAVICDFSSIMPASVISGNTAIRNGSFIGTGAIVLEGLTISENCIIGAGAVVTKDTVKSTTVVGVPARSTE